MTCEQVISAKNRAKKLSANVDVDSARVVFAGAAEAVFETKHNVPANGV